MFQLLIGLLLFLFLIFIIPIIFGTVFLKTLFTKRKRGEETQQQTSQKYPTDPSQPNKIFDDKEGEYVDFEEIKNDK